MPDHVHLLVEVDPQYGIHRLVRSIKGRSSRLLRQEYPWLKSTIANTLDQLLLCLDRWQCAFGSHQAVHRKPETSLLNGQKTVDFRNGLLAEGPFTLQYGSGVIKFRKVAVKPL